LGSCNSHILHEAEAAALKWGNTYYKLLQAVTEGEVAELVQNPTDICRVLHRLVSLPPHKKNPTPN